MITNFKSSNRNNKEKLKNGDYISLNENFEDTDAIWMAFLESQREVKY